MASTTDNLQEQGANLPGRTTSMTQRRALHDQYSGLKQRAYELPSALVKRLQAPYLISPGDSWNTGANRVFIVGQEPNIHGFDVRNTGKEWIYPPIWTLQEFMDVTDGVEALMFAYEAHSYEKAKKHVGGPFQDALRYLRGPLTSGLRHVTISTNLFRCALNPEHEDNRSRSPLTLAKPDDLEQILAWQKDILQKEIEILQPDAVIFMSGPDYDEALKWQLPGVSFNAVPLFTLRQLARLSHPLLPLQSFRTYHPSFLTKNTPRWHLFLDTLKQLACRPLT